MGYAESSKTERLANLMNGRVMWMKLQWPSFAWHPCIPPGLSTPRSWPKGERKRQHPSPPANCIAWVLRQGQVIDCTNGRTENINSWHRLRIHMITRQSPPPDVTNGEILWWDYNYFPLKSCSIAFGNWLHRILLHAGYNI